MTCIVGLEDNGIVWMGGDSAATGDTDQQIRSEPKVFRNGSLLIGYCGSFRMGQLLQFALKPPKQGRESDLVYLVTKFVNTVRKCYQKGGWLASNQGQVRNGLFLLGYRGRLYSVEHDFQIGRVSNGMNACGCGDAYALGNLLATAGQPPQERILAALKSAEMFSAGVRSPFTVLNSAN